MSGNHGRQSCQKPLTKPIEPKFEAREMERPKKLSQVKLEQDLELARREQEGAYALRFAARKVCLLESLAN
jgi:hypothetical protein